MKIKKIQDLNPKTKELLDLEFKYQPELTKKLDDINSDFDQELINEIVLWKVNRYAGLTSENLALLNKIKPKSQIIDENLTRKILSELLQTKGIRLPMASTILRYKNPDIYQIIDQRVYRIIYGVEHKIKYNLKDNIEQYLTYLKDLRKVCEKFQIPFNQSDRILYRYDKEINSKNIKH
jgi:thermostable 8-oxoguanine DNA glycosylase